MNRKLTPFNSYKSLEKKIAKNLSKADMWLAFRLDNDGIHLDCPNEEHISLLAIFLSAHPEILKQVNEFAQSKDGMEIFTKNL